MNANDNYLVQAKNSLPLASAVEIIKMVLSFRLSFCSSVLPSIYVYTRSQAHRLTYIIFDLRVDREHISDKFDGQDDRSKVKVSMSKNGALCFWSVQLVIPCDQSRDAVPPAIR